MMTRRRKPSPKPRNDPTGFPARLQNTLAITGEVLSANAEAALALHLNWVSIVSRRLPILLTPDLDVAEFRPFGHAGAVGNRVTRVPEAVSMLLWM